MYSNSGLALFLAGLCSIKKKGAKKDAGGAIHKVANAKPTPATTATATAASTPVPTAAGPRSKDPLDLGNLLSQDKGSKNEPTYINSKTLTVNNETRIFQYAGNVQVKHGEMTLSADMLDGKYDENNQIVELVARKKVLITKGDAMKATCERAVYNAKTRVITLMENPQLEQNGSNLSADVIKVFMDENRSTAEGQVRVKVVQKDLKSAGTQLKQ